MSGNVKGSSYFIKGRSHARSKTVDGQKPTPQTVTSGLKSEAATNDCLAATDVISGTCKKVEEDWNGDGDGKEEDEEEKRRGMTALKRRDVTAVELTGKTWESRRRSEDSSSNIACEKGIISYKKSGSIINTKTFFNNDEDSVSIATIEPIKHDDYSDDSDVGDDVNGGGSDTSKSATWRDKANRLFFERKSIVHRLHNSDVEDDPFYKENSLFQMTFEKTLGGEFDTHFKSRRGLPYVATKIGERDASGRRADVITLPSPFDNEASK